MSHSQIRRRLVMAAALAMTQAALGAPDQVTPDGPVVAERTQTKAEMQPQAVDALNRLGAYLRSLHGFRIEADSVTDAVLTNGQNVGFLHHTEMSVVKPDKLKVVVSGSRAPRGLVYDGQSVILFDDTDHYYSKAPAPSTITQLIADASQKYGIQLPLVDLFYWGQQSDDEKALTGALYLGLDQIQGKGCNHYAYQQPGIDWELWIQDTANPLPCRFVVTDTTQPSRPRHEVDYRWTLNPSFDATTFVFNASAESKQIPLRAPGDAQHGDAQ